MSVDSSILIAEECQNITKLQMKTLITRIGNSSKFIISGDLEQVDRKDKATNGLQDALNKFSNMEEIGVVEFGKEDIVRNPLISKLLSKY
jgi:phosphate starvation-inducible PhoH-like protein